jgi:hypothetical protein
MSHHVPFEPEPGSAGPTVHYNADFDVVPLSALESPGPGMPAGRYVGFRFRWPNPTPEEIPGEYLEATYGLKPERARQVAALLQAAASWAEQGG